MGVHGLWKLLESTGKTINPETLEGKILAVDISIWLNQAVKGVRDREGNSVQNAHLLTLFHRLCKLLYFRIKPVFVFDGDAPLLKKQTLNLRRQRKEELNRESKQTNEKLLKTFLKRQAIKAALGERSTEPLPSISGVRRDEVDDMYVLPALPPQEEREKNSSEEEEEKEWEDMVDSHRIYQEELNENPNSVDINSEEFASLPPEVKHEILKDMKEFSKRRRTMYHKPPECSGEFSQYQLAGLLQRNKLNQKLEGVEREMSQRSAGGVEHLYNEEEHSVESRRLVSEDSAHYILIKGSKKREKVPESQPAALPWAGGPLSGRKRQGGGGRPEPLWRPISEEGPDEVSGPSPKVPKLSPSLRSEAAAPSPRTLQAIEAAMVDSFDEEEEEEGRGEGVVEGVQGLAGGDVSPRTLLAIRQALGEEDDLPPSKTPTGSFPVQRPAHRLVISSSSEEEPEGEGQPLIKTLTNEDRLGFRKHRPDLILPMDSVVLSSSEEELEEALSQRSRAFLSTALGHSEGRASTERIRDGGMEREKPKEKDGEMGCLLSTGGDDKERPGEAGGQKERSGPKGGVVTEPRSLPSTVSPPPSGSSLNGAEGARTSPITLTRLSPKEERNGQSEEWQARNDEITETMDSEDSDSEDGFIEISGGEEPKEEETGDSLTEMGGGAPSAEDHEDMTKTEEEEEEEGGTEGLSGEGAALGEGDEKEDSEDAHQDPQPSNKSSPAPDLAPNEWEHIDVGELAALESSLQAQQSSLTEQKQQQERFAATVTGQMCLESQELLRLFGVPFLVAPMEAEAQCASLDRADQTHGTITDDSDVWLFGGRHVYKNFFSQNKYVEHYQYVDLQNQLGLDRTKLINLAYLLGSDYTEGVPGVGYVSGMEILNEFPGPGIEPLLQFSDWWAQAQQERRLVSDPRDTKVKRKLRGLKLQPGFPNPAVAHAYLQPPVDQSDGSFSWGLPHLDLIKEFCLSRFGWNSRKTEEVLRPVLKQLKTQQTQSRIDSFFRLEQQERQAIRSQRLRRAITCLKRKDGGAEGEGDSEPEDTKSKSKKGKGRKQQKGGGEEGKEAPGGSGGGFLGSELAEPAFGLIEDVGGASQKGNPAPRPNKGVSQPKPHPQSQSSSSGEDCEGDSRVTMVTARSVFEGNPRGRGGRGRGGKGRVRGRGTKAQ
ncbi:DNA excision repair protein ERCC-5 homolog [Osmerus eperlanus]|uniref:DNA excision repair protein ERCC-5 homolog n=1 Tax=Osmerus eperlanus TaxID=29151 RepID=UPI002E15120F